MLKNRLIPSLVLTAGLLFPPHAAVAQASSFDGRFAAAAEFCAVNDEAACLAFIFEILADLQSLPAGEEYNLAIASFVIAMVSVLDEGLPSSTFDVIAAAIVEIAESSTDPELAAEILVIAELVAEEEIVGDQAEDLLASPN